MRCTEVIRELAAPTGTLSPEGLAAHLSGCPKCASENGRQARLEQLWAATRPAEPPAAVWESVWAKVSEAAEAAPAPVLRFPAAGRSRPWKRVAIVALGFAQAAAVLAAAFLTRPDEPRLQLASRLVRPAVSRTEVDIPYGRTDLIQFLGQGEIKVVSRAEPEENSNSVDSNFVMLGILEAMAE